MKKINMIVLFLLYMVNLKAVDEEKKKDKDIERSTTESRSNKFYSIKYMPQEVLEIILSFLGLDINSITDSNIKQLLEISKVNWHLKKTVDRALKKIKEKTNAYLNASKSPVKDAARLRTYFAKRWLQKQAAEDESGELAKIVGQKIRKYLRISADLRAGKRLSKKQKQKQNRAILKASFLMQSGIGLNIPGRKSDCPLMIAVSQNNIDMVKKLLKSGANPNVKDDIGDSALIRAVEQNNMKIAKLLLRHGAHPNMVDMIGDTALAVAATNRNIAIVKLLLQYNADIKTKNKLGLTVMQSVNRCINKILKSFKKIGAEATIIAENHLHIYREIVKILKNYKLNKLNEKSSQCIIS